jgi:hypothetical protein
MAEISATPPDLVPDIWDDVYPFFKPAMDADIFLTEERLYSELISDKALLFIATIDGTIKGAAVVRIEEMKSKVVNVVMLGGKNMKEWKQSLLDALKLYARGMGCRYIVSSGRPAWSRLLPEFKAEKTIYYAEVTCQAAV